MSGHSKWAQIKRKKAVTDAKRGAVFSKISKEIIVAARLGGPDPVHNFRLRFAIEKAKTNLMPQNNIQRAIEKGAGLDTAEKIEEVVYEGYGPGGAAILVLCTTDNRNRTVADLRSYFSKYHGKFAESGAVSWMFIKRGEIKISKSSFKNQDQIYELAIEAGAEDIDFSESEEFAVIITKPDELEKVQKNILAKNIKPIETYLSFHPKEHIEISDPDCAKKLVNLLEVIEEHDDVQEVYSNFDIKEDVLNAN